MSTLPWNRFSDMGFGSFWLYVVVACCGLQSSGTRRELEEADYPLRHPEFRYKTEFQSHDPEVFDLLCFLLTQLFGYTFYLSFHALSLFTSLITSRVWR